LGDKLNILEVKNNALLLTPLKIFHLRSGDVLHAMKCSDEGFTGFGEAYFSTIEPGMIKGWKRHREMTLNLIVPFGTIRFIVLDDRNNNSKKPVFEQFVLSKKNYCRLTVPPMVWVGFQALGKTSSLLLNIADIPHSTEEIDQKNLNEFDFDWSLKK
jgi:dTDP-4-dehydrorhamnose 3,5-epimerase